MVCTLHFSLLEAVGSLAVREGRNKPEDNGQKGRRKMVWVAVGHLEARSKPISENGGAGASASRPMDVARTHWCEENRPTSLKRGM